MSRPLMSTRLGLLMAGLCLVLSPATVRSSGGPGYGWESGFTISDLDDRVFSLAVYDDGRGPALYAGGAFTAADDLIVSHIARWDGTGWSALGYIAKWDGTEWSALNGPAGTGLNDDVLALAVYDNGSGKALYVGGIFTTAGGVPVNYIAQWNGTRWSALSGPSGIGTSIGVTALAVYDDGRGAALYAAGAFRTAGGVPVNYIAKWDGTGWSALSGRPGAESRSLCATEGAIRSLRPPDAASGVSRWNRLDPKRLSGGRR